jgi:predicted DNA binding protein
MIAWNLSDDNVNYLLFHVIGEREPYVAALAEVESVESYDITPTTEDSFYMFIHDRTSEAAQQFLASFQHPSLLAVPPLEYRPGGELRFSVIGEPDALRAALAAIPDAIAIEIEEVGEYDRRRTPSGFSLTDRQREALEAGTRTGYYDVPRTGSVEDVASELDCAASTASNHLRKAESRLVGEVIER